MSSVGYGYSRSDIGNIATDYAIFLKKKCPGAKLLSHNWLYSFMERHTNLAVLTPKGLDLIRAKGSTPEIIKKYFDTLDAIIDKYGFKDYHQRIINTGERIEHHTHTSKSSMTC